MDEKLSGNVLVVPKEKATFWMDSRGHWHNQHGPFENQKIIDYFNTAIQWDTTGYYVAQQRGGIAEKVYFSFEDTALFVVDVIQNKETMLLLNTRKQILLFSDKLYICNDQLYLLNAGERIKFSDRALLKMADKIIYDTGQYFFNEGGQRRMIRSESDIISDLKDETE